MDRGTLSRLNTLRRARRAALLVTALDTGAQQILLEGETVAEELLEATRRAFHTGKSAKVDVGGRSLFLHIQMPPVRIAVIGAVRIAEALVPMATRCGFEVEIVDPREGFLSRGRFAEGRLVAGLPGDHLAVDPFTAVVAVAHVPELDDAAIAAGLRGRCFYVGALGSRRSHAARLDRLRSQGFDEARLARIHAPIGLDIGAATPAEIAVAILAEIIQCLRRRPLEREEAV